MKTTYLFYDLETSGLSKTFDQVMQFAAIRTDENLHELERYEHIIKLNPDTIPSPEASITHRISIKDTETGLPEITAMEQIHQLLNTPGTISLGYNTLGFDDEFLRFSFYRNLLPAYTHQFANQCGRADIYPMTLMYYLYQNDALMWPEVDGHTSLKLENINHENQLATGQAHNAIVDVEATIALAKKLKEHPKMWDYLIKYFDKTTDTKRLQQLPAAFGNYQYGIYIEGKIGHRNNFATPVLSLGQHYHYKNQTVWLRLDTAELRETKTANIAKTTWCFTKKYAEPGFLLPPTEHYLAPISEERVEHMRTNLAWLEQHPEIVEAIAAHHCDFTYPDVPNVDVDAALYLNGFPSRIETEQCAKLHNSLEHCQDTINAIRNKNLQHLAIRAIGRMDKTLLSSKQQQVFDDYFEAVLSDENELIDFKGNKRITIKAALKTAQELPDKRPLDSEQMALLEELMAYLSTTKRVS